jgi:hypothetical protein
MVVALVAPGMRSAPVPPAPSAAAARAARFGLARGRQLAVFGDFCEEAEVTGLWMTSARKPPARSEQDGGRNQLRARRDQRRDLPPAGQLFKMQQPPTGRHKG